MGQQSLPISSLHALRGLAALLVMVMHFDSMAVHLNLPKAGVFISNCYLMVDLFFMMSGFIMMHVYGPEFEKGLTSSKVKQFFRARLARIYPLHLMVLLVLILIVYGHLNPYMSGTLTDMIHAPSAFVTNVFLLQSFGLHSIFTWNPPSWSISAEAFAYLLFPILFWFTKHYKYALVFLALMAFVLYLGVIYFVPRSQVPWNLPNLNDLNVTYEFGYLRGLAGFICGMISYRIYLRKKLMTRISQDWLVILLIIILVLCMQNHINNLMYVPSLMLLVIQSAANNGMVKAFCLLKPLQFLGTISYSIYLWHYLLILCVAIPAIDLAGYHYTAPGSVLVNQLQWLVMLVLFAMVVVVFSWLSYRFIEKPLRDKWNGISGK